MMSLDGAFELTCLTPGALDAVGALVYASAVKTSKEGVKENIIAFCEWKKSSLIFFLTFYELSRLFRD